MACWSRRFAPAAQTVVGKGGRALPRLAGTAGARYLDSMWAGHECIDCHPSVSVVHLLDLNGLKGVLSAAGRQGFRVFQPLTTDVPGGPTEAAMAEFLQAHLQHRTDADVEGFLTEVLEAMNVVNGRTDCRRLTWVTLWDSFAPFAKERPDRWLDLVGICRADFPRWIMALRYPVWSAGLVARPTPDDARGNAFFYGLLFPGPGRAMDLAGRPPAAPPLPELVHLQIKHDIEHWKGSGCLLGPTAHATCGSLEEHQRRHELRLRMLLGDVIPSLIPPSAP